MSPLSALMAALPEPATEAYTAGAELPSGPGLRVLLEGEVSLRRDGRLVGFVEGPAALDPDAFLGGGPGRGWRAETPVRVACWPASCRDLVRADPDALRAAVALLAEAVAALEEERYDTTLSFDDCFTPAGELPAPPYRFDPVRGVILVVQGAAARLAALRPPGVRGVPGLGGRYLLLISDLRDSRVASADADGRSFAYQEITPLLPCLARGRPGAYVPELWPDSIMATLLGREIYGFPKRVGRVRLRDGGVDLVVDRERTLRGRWSVGAELTAGQLAEEVAAALVPGLPEVARRWISRLSGGLARRGVGTPVSAFVRRRLRDEQRPGRWREDALVEVPFWLDPATDVHRLDALDVRFHPVQRVLHGEVLAGWVLTTGFGLEAGRPIHRFRSPLWRR